MSATLACMAGESIYKLVESGQLKARAAGARKTPFGAHQPIFLIEAQTPYYLLLRRSEAGRAVTAGQVNWRANLYTLKDLGVQAVLSWSAAGSITHNLSIGQVVIPDDMLDMTHQRSLTFFEDSDLGLLRQFPVFCPALRQAMLDVLDAMNIETHFGGTVAVMEGPRLETPAEVRMLAAIGAELVSHSLAPEVFLARELQMCFAGACYLVNYAETGSRHRPFSTGDLFGGLAPANQAERLARMTNRLPDLLEKLAERTRQFKGCECARSMSPHIESGQLPADWRDWFGA